MRPAVGTEMGAGRCGVRFIGGSGSGSVPVTNLGFFCVQTAAGAFFIGRNGARREVVPWRGPGVPGRNAKKRIPPVLFLSARVKILSMRSGSAGRGVRMRCGVIPGKTAPEGVASPLRPDVRECRNASGGRRGRSDGTCVGACRCRILILFLLGPTSQPLQSDSL